MERDFMGLAVKQEISEEFADAVPSRSSPMQWPFLQKGSSLLSSHGVQEEKPTAGFEYSITSARSGTLNTTEAFDSSQKNIVNENQGGVRYTMTNYPTKHLDTCAFHRPNTIQMFSPSPTTSTHLAMRSNSPLVGTTDLRNASNVAGGAPQLTIFYNGSVCVYDDVAPEKPLCLSFGKNLWHGFWRSGRKGCLVQIHMLASNLKTEVILELVEKGSL